MNTTGKTKKSILVVDDEDALRSAVCEYLTHIGYDVVDSASGANAIVKVTQENFDAIISDIRMPGISGLDLIHVFDKLCRDTVVILLTSVPDPDGKLAALSREAGCFAYINKPCKLQVLQETLEQAFTERGIFVGTSPANLQPDQAQGSASTQSDSVNANEVDVNNVVKIDSEPETPDPIQSLPETTNETYPSNADQITRASETPASTQDSSKGASQTDADSGSLVMTEVESIIRDPNQLPQQDEDKAMLKLEIYSHHHGELHLNKKHNLMREIEDVLLRPKKDVRRLSAQEYVAISSEDFLAKGWENQFGPLEVRGKEIHSFDLYKEGIALKFGFQSTTLMADFINFQKAYESENINFDIAVLVIQTGASQKYLKKKTGKSWSGVSFSEAIRILKSLQRNLDVPICILGLEISDNVNKYEIELSSYARNIAPAPMKCDGTTPELILGDMSTPKIKDCVFHYLQEKYDITIERNLRIKSNQGAMELDGLMRLSMDVLLEIEMSKSMGIPIAKYFSCINEDDIAEPLKDYQRHTGRMAAMRLILLGEFTPGYVRDLSWMIENACKLDERLKIDYIALSFEEIGIRAHSDMKGAH